MEMNGKTVMCVAQVGSQADRQLVILYTINIYINFKLKYHSNRTSDEGSVASTSSNNITSRTLK